MNLSGIIASRGLAIAKVLRIEKDDLKVSQINTDSIDNEIKSFDLALEKSKLEIEKIRDKALLEVGYEHASIFDAHIEMLKDPELYKNTVDEIIEFNLSAASAFRNVSEKYIMIFEEIEDEYIKRRSEDIKDISERILKHLLDLKVNRLREICEDVIIVAENLTPSDTIQLNKKFVKGFITMEGGETSHTSILARTLDIPAMVGVKNALNYINNGDIIILDCISGELIVNPSISQIEIYNKKLMDCETEKKNIYDSKSSEVVTLDGHKIQIGINICDSSNIDECIINKLDGVGLLRTEFLYMNKNEFPTEQEQFEMYKNILEKFGKKTVIIRTLDIGGDKELSYFSMPKELNPFLGQRAIRFCLENIDLFRTQLRALLRASMYGNLRIMFPMIATLEELRSAKEELEIAKKSLLEEGILVSETYEIGMMIEVPSAALLADQFAKEVDFFSIGTNDLIQYTFAADRMNDNVSYLYQPYHPSILKLIKMVVDASHKEGIWTGICGEMAGDANAVLLLVGLGLDELSMSINNISPIINLINKIKYSEMKTLSEEAILLDSNNGVKKLVERKMSEIIF